MMARRFTDMTGYRSGMLEALRIHHIRQDGRKAYWECKCDCGNLCVVAAENLKSGKTRSCGCLRSKRKPNTICWLCDNATDGRKCPWVAFGKPVEGWKAEPTIILNHDPYHGTMKQRSFKVLECPLFVQGRW